MAIRQNVGIGGLYPTGRAPLAVDLATPTAAITQRMIKREEQRIAGEKEQISANQQAILKALDFETVQGLSDKIQTEHLENLNKVWNNWAEKFASKQGKLSFADLKELQDDKRKIESNLGKMQADVKTFAFAQNELSKPNARQLWDEQSWLNLKDYANQGKVGSGDAINILVPRQPSFMEYLQSTYKTQLAGLDKKISNRWIGVTDEGRVSAQKDNLDAANNMWESLKQQPDVKQYIGQIGETQAKEQFLNAYGFSVKDDYFSQGVWEEVRKGEEVSGIRLDTQRALERNDIKVDSKYADNVRQANEMAEQIRLANEEAVNTLKNRYIPKLGGTPENVYVQYKKDGFVIRMRRGDKLEKMEYPYAYSDDFILKEHKLGAFGDPSSSAKVYAGGKQIPDNVAGVFAPRWKLENPINPMIPDQYNKLIIELDKPFNKIDLETVVGLINNKEQGMLPDVNIEIKDNTIKFNGEEYQIKRGWAGRQVKGTSDIEDDKKKLKDDILKEIDKYRNKLKSQAIYAEDTQPKGEDESVDEFGNWKSPNREEYINLGLTNYDTEVLLDGKSMTAEEAVDFLRSKGVATADAIKEINQKIKQ